MSTAFLYRSRAVQISMNLSVIEEWIGNMELPKNIGSHFGPVHDLLMWLQVCSFTLSYKNVRVLMHVVVLVVYHRVPQPHCDHPEHEESQSAPGQYMECVQGSLGTALISLADAPCSARLQVRG